MESDSKLEIISNIKDKINQFKTNYSKNKQQNNNLNFEINRDTLKLFFKNKTNEKDNNIDFQKNKDDNLLVNNGKILEIKNISNKPIKTNSYTSNLPKKEVNENPNIKLNNRFTYEMDNINDKKLNNLNYLKNEIYNKNTNNYIGNKPSHYIIEDESLFNNNYQNYNKRIINNEKNQEHSLGNINLNNSKHFDFNIGEIMKHKKLEKKEKSAPRISINENFLEKPLTDKKRENILQNDNLAINYINNTLNNFYTVNNNMKTRSRKASNTEGKLQQLLMEFNINSSRNNTKRKIPYLDLNLNKNNENNYNKLNTQNKLKDINSLYENRRNTNNTSNKKINYFNDVSRLDFFKNVPTKQIYVTSESKSIIKEKMDMFYRELNKEPKSNINLKENKFFTKNNLNDIRNINDYMKNNNEKLNNTIYINRNIENKELESNKIDFSSFNKIIRFKQYIKNLNKENMHKLSYDIQSELREICNILNQKININN